MYKQRRIKFQDLRLLKLLKSIFFPSELISKNQNNQIRKINYREPFWKTVLTSLKMDL